MTGSFGVATIHYPRTHKVADRCAVVKQGVDVLNRMDWGNMNMEKEQGKNGECPLIIM